MSGSTIGGVVGGVVGFYATGGTMQGAQMGFMIGSAVGGYVDPDIIEGQRLSDAQAQTSMEGAMRSIIYGTAVVAGNLIQTGELHETRHRERTGKGGAVQETWTYSRSYAIRICEASPFGECQVTRIWRDGKIVYDVRDESTPQYDGAWADDIQRMKADTAAFASKMTIYSGAEGQLPDPTLESLPANYGGGVGNVPAYVGTCYMVLANDDLTERAGTIPEYRFEVVSNGTLGTISTDAVIGAQMGMITLPGDKQFVGSEIDGETRGIRYWTHSAPLAVGAEITTGVVNDSLGTLMGAGFGYEAAGTVATVSHRGSHFIDSLTGDETWSISADGAGADTGGCNLFRNGVHMADLRPTLGTGLNWWYGEVLNFPEYAGLVWFSDSSVFIGVRRTGGGTYNRIFRWGLNDESGEITAAGDTSEPVTAGTLFFMHRDTSGTLRAIAKDEGELVTYSNDLTSYREALPFDVSGTRAFAVDRGLLFLLVGGALKVYDMAQSFALLQTITMSGSADSHNHQIHITDTAIWVRSGVYLKRIDYYTTCFISQPPGWHVIPEMPGYLTDGTSIYPLCSLEESAVTPASVILGDIVTDVCDRVGVDATQLDVSELTDAVRGFVIGRQLPAAEVIRSLQQGHFFDFPEWDLKLRGIKRGGAPKVAITDDDLLWSDDDQDTRAQSVEFPRKINLISADPSVDYEPTKQTAERRTTIVKAVGETTVELPLALTRDEAARKADVMLKVAWEEALGRWERELPEEFSQYTPSDCFTHEGKRWRIEQTERGDGVSAWKAVRDRASAYTSVVTGSTPRATTPPVSGVKGPTLFHAMNLPQLWTADSSPGMYVAARGVLPGWNGASLRLSVDGGATFETVLMMSQQATMGELAAGAGTSGTLSVLVGGGELESVTVDQIAARANAFAIIGGTGVCEVGQFQTATETGAGAYDLTDVTRGLLDTVPAAYSDGAPFVKLGVGVYFLPIDQSHAGKTLIFRAVTYGTAEANATNYSVVFEPPTYVIDGGEIT